MLPCITHLEVLTCNCPSSLLHYVGIILLRCRDAPYQRLYCIVHQLLFTQSNNWFFLIISVIFCVDILMIFIVTYVYCWKETQILSWHAVFSLLNMYFVIFLIINYIYLMLHNDHKQCSLHVYVSYLINNTCSLECGIPYITE